MRGPLMRTSYRLSLAVALTVGVAFGTPASAGEMAFVEISDSATTAAAPVVPKGTIHLASASIIQSSGYHDPTCPDCPEGVHYPDGVVYDECEPEIVYDGGHVPLHYQACACLQTIGLNIAACFDCHDDECEYDVDGDGECDCPDCRAGRKPCRFGYFSQCGNIPWAGRYSRVYPLNSQYVDARDQRLYAAQGTGVPMTVPLAPTVGHSYNFGWGVPSSRLTPMYRNLPYHPAQKAYIGDGFDTHRFGIPGAYRHAMNHDYSLHGMARRLGH